MAVSVFAIGIAGVLLTRPVDFQATATVQVNGLVLPDSQNDEHQRSIDEYGAALTAQPVVAAASRTTGVPARRIARSVGYGRPTDAVTSLYDAGFAVAVTFSSTDRASAERVVAAEASGALHFLASRKLAEADAEDVAAQARLTAAAKALAGMASVDGAVDIDATNLDGELTGLRDVQAQAPDQTVLASEVAATGAALGRADTEDARYAGLTLAFDRAVGAARDTAASRLAAAAAVAGMSAEVGSVSSEAVPGHTKDAALGGFIAGAAVLLVALMVIARREISMLDEETDASLAGVGQTDTNGFGPANGNGHANGNGNGHGARRTGATVRASLLRRVPIRLVTVAVLVVTVPVAVGLAVGVLHLVGASHAIEALVIAFPVGAAAVALATFRFEWFLYFLLAIRASIDSIGGGGVLAPSSAVGTLFILAAILWLLTQYELGRWKPMSAVTKWLWAFAGACVLSIPTSMRPVFSTQSTLKAISGILMFSVLEQYLAQRPRRVAWLVTCLLLSSAWPIVLGTEQALLGKGNTNYVDVSRIMANFAHPSTYATYLLLLAPLMLVRTLSARGVRRIALGSVALLATVLVIFTYTRAAWIGIIAIIAYLGVRVWRRLLWVLLVGVIVVLVAIPSVLGRLADLDSHAAVPAGVPTNSLAWRFGYWLQVIPLANSNPITGIGFDATQEVTAEQLQPHNGFVEAYVETGVVGLVCICGVIWSLVQYLRRRLAAAHPGHEQRLALVAVASAIGLACQFPVENLLTQTFVYWYFAAVMTFGYPFEEGARYELEDLATTWIAEVRRSTPGPAAVSA